MNKYTEIYDLLINDIPINMTVDSFAQGVNWTYVESNNNYGISMTVGNYSSPESDLVFKGKKLRDVAELTKSWNFYEASIGVAALNAYYNNKDRINEDYIESENNQNSFMNISLEKLKDKNVLCVGKFRDLDCIKEISNLNILERNSSSEVLPDSACEYIFSKQDYIFITGSSLTNKTLPRLLELCPESAYVTLAGPSVVLNNNFYDLGVDCLSSLVITNPVKVEEIVKTGVWQKIHKAGKMVNLKNVK